MPINNARTYLEFLRMADPMHDEPDVKEALAVFVRIGERFVKRQTEIENDLNLSDVGRRSALRAASQESTAAVRSALEPKLAAYDRAIKSADAEITKAVNKPGDGPSVKADLLVNHLLVQLEACDSLEVIALYSSATPEVRAAIEGLPARVVRDGNGTRWEPWVTADIVANQRMGAAVASNPDAVARLERVRDLRRTIEGLANGLINALRSAAPDINEPVSIGA